MVWFLIVVLAGALVLALLLLGVLVRLPTEDRMTEEELIGQQQRSAERQLHDIARDGFVAMLDEARSRAGR